MTDSVEEKLPVPTEAKAKKATPTNLKNKKKRYSTDKAEHGFMYIGHLPHGFYDEEIKGYFSQFGKVIRVRVARSKKTGNHKGYGFVEFADKDVAQIAADTMNNYLMFNKLLKCQIIPKERLHPDTFKNAGKEFLKPVSSWIRRKFNCKRSAEQLEKLKTRQEKKMLKRSEKLKELGINLDFSQLNNLAAIASAPATTVEKKVAAKAPTPAQAKKEAQKTEPKATKPTPAKKEVVQKPVEKAAPVKATPAVKETPAKKAPAKPVAPVVAQPAKKPAEKATPPPAKTKNTNTDARGNAKKLKK